MHPNCVAVDAVLERAGVDGRVRILDEAAPTAASAAALLGVAVGAIANSLVFATAEGTPLLIMTSGAHRVDPAKVAALVGTARLRRADPDFVHSHTGQRIGGVAPVAHPKRLRTVVDVALAGYPEIWAAGGVPTPCSARRSPNWSRSPAGRQPRSRDHPGVGHDRYMRSAERPPVAGAHLESWTGHEFAARVDDVMRIYVRAMRYPDHTGAQRAVSARKHVAHEGFACRAAVLDEGTLIGFGYGYTTKPGQWWHDLVRNAVSPEAAHDWLQDAFELSELHVLPEYHGIGVGRRLLTSLADGIPHSAMLLSTPDQDTRAFRLYRAAGFVDLARNYLFPGDARPFAVLGARLPLRDGR